VTSFVLSRATGNAIMREAKLRGLGVAIAVEMFNLIIATNPDLRYASLLCQTWPHCASQVSKPTGCCSCGWSLESHRKHGAPDGRRIFKLQILRAVACNIVKHRDFYPTKEVLLKHSMSYLGMLDEFKGASCTLNMSLCHWLRVLHSSTSAQKHQLPLSYRARLSRGRCGRDGGGRLNKPD
jgi:hypothetical protein